MVGRYPGCLSVYPAISIGGIDRRPMSEDLGYRRIEISGLGGTLPEKAGTFVVGNPRRIIEDLWNKNPPHSDDAIFRTLVSASEHDKMGDWLTIPANTSTVDQQFPFTGTAETRGAGPSRDQTASQCGPRISII
jgi:hypothetical protein